MKNKLIFYAIWVLLVSLGPIAVFSNTDLQLVSGNRVLLANFLQRIFGVTAYTMLFIQIILGSFMQKWTERLGGWVLRFHITEGVIVYALIILHPLMFVFLRYFDGGSLDPFYIFTQVCVLCNPITEYYYTLGRIGFWLVTIAVFAGLFRNATPFMRTHWKKFHALNYLTFLLIGVHSFLVGTDFSSTSFFAFAIIAYLAVLYIVVFKKLPELIQNVLRWMS